jgi:transposase
VYKVLNSAATLIQTTTTEAPRRHMYYIGLDVHKKTISYCVKDASGQVHQEGQVGAKRWELDRWMQTLPQPWIVAMEATIFTGWIYDHLLPHAQQVKVAHPLMLRAIAAAKKKNDRIDAGKIADCLRCDFLPECHMASTAIRDRRRTLRYRHLLVRQMVQMKNRISGLLMETGVSHNKRRLHKVGYFRELLASNEEVNESIRPLLRLSRDTIVRLQKTEYALVSSLQRDPLLAERIKRLRTVPGVGPITALTWALEMGEVCRFPSIRQAISYCGLCGDEKSSADKVTRTPLSKQRNKHIQRVLVEAAKLAPRQDHNLALVYEREKQKGNANRATLAVARKMVAYLLAVDRGQRDFVPLADSRTAAA